MNKPELRILVIDDNPDSHLDFIKILKISKYASKLASFEEVLFNNKKEVLNQDLPEFKIDTATQGEEGVAKVKEALAQGNPFALGFVDVRPENLNKIFQYGFTTKENGHGFGLHSCALTAKEMNGEIRVFSEGLDKGATFTLILPLSF